MAEEKRENTSQMTEKRQIQTGEQQGEAHFTGGKSDRLRDKLADFLKSVLHLHRETLGVYVYNIQQISSGSRKADREANITQNSCLCCVGAERVT